MSDHRAGYRFFVHDAVDYMTTEDDQSLAVQTAYAHCRPGRLAVFVPDDIAETFEESTDHGGDDSPRGQENTTTTADGGDHSRAVRYLEWTRDPDPTDSWALTEYALLLRDHDGAVRVIQETHRIGVFGRDVWLRVLAQAGFDAEALDEQTTDDRPARVLFLGHRPAESVPAQRDHARSRC